MRINGHINIQIETGGGNDPVTGFPIPVVKDWGENIPCSFTANVSASKGAYQDGKFTIASYIIDLEAQDLPTFDTIRLTDPRGNVIGTGEEGERTLLVGNIEYLDTVERVRIIV